MEEALESLRKTEPVKVNSKLDIVSKIVFGLLCMGILWVSGGGDATLFWERAGIFSVMSIGFVVAWFFICRPLPMDWIIPRPTATELKKSAGLASIAVLLTLPFFGILSNIQDSIYFSIGVARDLFLNMSFIVLPVMAAATYAYCLFSRGFLCGDWGFHNVVLLEALFIGVAFQNFPIFLLVYFMGILSMLLSKNETAKTQAQVHFIWIIVFFVGMRVIVS